MSILKPRDFIGDLPCRSFHYREIHFDSYYWIGRSVADEGIIIGLTSDATLDTSGLDDIRGTYVDYLKEKYGFDANDPAIIRVRKILSTHSIRSAWAEDNGISFSYSTLKKHTILCHFLELYEEFATMDKSKVFLPDILLSLCKKYGLPLFITANEPASPPMIDLSDNDIITPSMDDSLYYGFFIETFMRRIELLYSLYLAWKYLYYNDDNAIKLLESMQLMLGDDKRQNIIDYIMGIPNLQISTKKSLFFDKRGNATYTEQTENLLSALTLQMMDLIVAGTHGLEGKSLYSCIACGSQFIRSHKNAKLCEKCRANAEKLRKHRANKKLEKGGTFQCPRREETMTDQSASVKTDHGKPAM